MNLQIGVKTLSEIESLISSNCWKAIFWIHNLLLVQLRYLFYYTNQTKTLGRKRVTLIIDEPALISLDNLEEHKSKWGKVEGRLKYMDTAIDICYSRSLIDEELESLKQFNSFRNKRLGHPDLSIYLPSDEEVRNMCNLGLEIVKKLDNKIKDALKAS